MRKIYFLTLGIILISFIVAFYVYPKMPNEMASHWNIKGEVDDYMSKLWGTFLIPFLSFVLFFLLVMIPELDPLKKNVKDFRKHYDRFVLVMVTFLFYIYLLTIFWNLDYHFNMTQLIAPSFAALFYYIGVLTQHAKRNWFIGIRTPWTLSSEEVWNKTHKRSGVLFKLSGFIALFGVILPNQAIWFILLPVIISAIYLIIYSYFEFKKQ